VLEDAADEELEAGGLIPGLAIVDFFGESGSLASTVDAMETGLFNELVLATPKVAVAAAAPTGLLIAVFVATPADDAGPGGPFFTPGPDAALPLGPGRCLALTAAFS
jgi:hypothetical protein